MAEDKSGFILYADLIHTVEQMPDELAGKLLKIILEYVNDRNPEINDLLLKIAFEPIKRQLKRDLKSWESKRKKLSDAGKAGAEARWHRDKDDGQAMRSHTTASDSMASMAVTVTDTVTDTVNDISLKSENLKKLVRNMYEDETWQISVRQLYPELRTKNTLKKALNNFVSYCESSAEYHSDEKSCRRHFTNWFKYQN